MRRLLFQLAAICFGGAALGLGLNAASPHPASLFASVHPASSSGSSVCTGPAAEPGADTTVARAHGRMPLSEAIAACGACTAAFVDARGAAAYAQGHIPAAVHLPPAGEPGDAETIAELRKHATIVIYDSGGDCGLAEGVADRLAAMGFQDLRLLDGSWTDWESAGGPALSGACQACSEHLHQHAGTEVHP